MLRTFRPVCAKLTFWTLINFLVFTMSALAAIQEVKVFTLGDANDTDLIYHAGQSVQFETITELPTDPLVPETIFVGNVRIQSASTNYDSGTQTLTHVRPGAYLYPWDTQGLLQADDYVASISLRDPTTGQTENSAVTVVIDNLAPAAITVTPAAEATATRSVQLQFDDVPSDVDEIMLDGDLVNDTSTFAWIPYTPNIVVNLTPGDGLKLVTARVRDAARNVSGPGTAQITLDQRLPQVALFDTQNGSRTFTNPRITLVLTLINTIQIHLSGDLVESPTTFRWVDYEPAATPPSTLEVQLTPGDGVKTITLGTRNAQLLDVAPVTIQVDLLEEPPSLSEFTATSPTVIGSKHQAGSTVQFRVTEAHQRDVLVGSVNVTGPQNVTVPFALQSLGNGIYGYSLDTTGFGDGQYTVAAILRDTFDRSAQDSLVITLDGTPPLSPQATVADVTKQRTVKLQLTADGAVDVRVTGDVAQAPQTFGWAPFAASMSVELLSAEGPKSILVEYRDDVGNVTQPVTATTYLDLQPPAITQVQVQQVIADDSSDFTFRPGTAIEALWQEDIAEPGLRGRIRITSKDSDYDTGQVDAELTQNGYTYVWETAGLADGRYTLNVRLVDSSGRVAQQDVPVTLDSVPPQVQSVLVDNGVAKTTNPDVILQLNAIGATEVLIEGDVASSATTFAWSPWLTDFPVTLSSGSGVKRILVTFRDRAGNVSETTKAVTELLAASIRRFEVSGSLAQTVNRQIRLVLEGENAAEMFLGGDLVDSRSTFQWVPTALNPLVELTPGDGPKVISATVRTDHGLQSAPATVTIDVVAERPSLGTVDATSTIGTQQIHQVGASVQLDVAESHGRADLSAELQISSPNYTSGLHPMPSAGTGVYTYTWNTTGLSDGEYLVEITAVDSFDRDAVATATIVLDGSAPGEPSVVLGDGSEQTDSRIQSLSVSADDDAVDVLLDGDIVPDRFFQTWQPLESPISVILTPGDGVKTLQVQVRDDVGNASSPSVTQVTLRESAPVTSLSVTSANGSENRHRVGDALLIQVDTNPVQLGLVTSLRIQSDTAVYDSGALTLTEQIPGSYSFTWNTQFLLEAEDYRIDVTLNDEVHPIVTEQLTVTLDGSAPREPTVVLGDGSEQTDSRIQSLSVSADDDAVDVQLSGDIVPDRFFQTWQPLESPISVILTPGDGVKTLQVQVRDEVGNASSPSVTQVTLRESAPVTSLSVTSANGSENRHRVGDALLIQVDTNPVQLGLVTSLRIQSDTAVYDSGALTLTEQIPGSYSFTWNTQFLLEAEDYHINVTLDDEVHPTVTEQLTVTLDGSAPREPTVVLGDGSEQTDSRIQSLSVSADDDAVDVQLSGDIVPDRFFQTWQPLESPISVILTPGDGVKTLQVQVRDEVGNASSPSVTQVTLRESAPVTSLSVTSANGSENRHRVGDALLIQVDTNPVQLGLVTSLRIQSDTAVYDSGALTLTEQVPGSYSFTWNTQFLLEAEDYHIDVTLDDEVHPTVTEQLTVILDGSAPGEPTVVLGDGSEQTDSRIQSLSVSAAEDAVDVQLSGDIVPDRFFQTWQPLESPISVILTPGDGVKTLQVQVRDEVGNASSLSVTQVTLRESAPVTSLSVTSANGSENRHRVGDALLIQVDTNPVQLGLVTSLRIQSDTAVYDSGALTLTEQVPGSYSFTWNTQFLLEAEDYRIDVTLDDEVHPTVTEQVVVNLDGTPPAQPEVQVAEETQIRTVDLEISSTEAHEVFVSGDIVLGPQTFGWIPHPSTLQVQLLPGDGEKQILVKVRDEVANETVAVTAVSRLNQAAPVLTGSQVNGIPVTDTSAFVFSPGTNVDIRFFENIPEPELTGSVRITAAGMGFDTGQLPAENTGNGYSFLWDTTSLSEADYEIELTLRDRYQREATHQFTIAIDTTPPQINAMAINGGASQISNPTVTLTLDIEDATEMLLEGDLVVGPETFAWVAWQPTVEVQLTSGDGPKRIEALFRDQVGNTTQPVTRATVLAADTPTDVEAQIADGAATVAQQDVSLQLSATSAAEIFVSGDISDDLNTFAWVPYVNSLPIYLLPGDGLKNVQVVFRSAAGLLSSPAAASVRLDREPPEIVSVTSLASATDADNVYRPGQAVLLSVVSTDTGSNLSATVRMESDDYDSQVQELALAPVQPTGSTEHQFAWNTDGLLDGEYSVTATVEDEAGHKVTDTSLQIIFDGTAPVNPELSISGADEITEARALEIALTADDATLMFVAGDVLPDNNTFLWVPYQETLTVNLAGGDGLKTLAARFRDDAGNETRDATAEIYLDQRKPQLLADVLWLDSWEAGTTSLVLAFDEPIDEVRSSAFSVKLSNSMRPDEPALEIRHRQDFILSDDRVVIPLTDDERLALEALGGRVSGETLEVVIAGGSVRDVAGQRNASNRDNPAVLLANRLSLATGWASTTTFNGESPWQLSYVPTVSARVLVTVRDADGNDVSTLVDEVQVAAAPQLVIWDGGELSEGAYTVNVMAEDSQTLQMLLLNRLEITLDTTGPTILESTPRDGAEGPANPRVELTVEDPVSGGVTSGLRDVVLLIGGASVPLTPSNEEPGHYALALALGLSPGEHPMEVQVTDQAGNVTSTSIRYTALNVQKPYLFNYPNPVSPGQSTTFRYVLPQLPDEGILRVYDAAGMVLYAQPLSIDLLVPGIEHDITWDGIDIFGQPLPRGIYFCELQLTFTDRSEQAIHKLAVR